MMLVKTVFHPARKIAEKIAGKVVIKTAFAGVFLSLLIGFGQDALSQARVKGEYATSRSPVYRVGDYDRELSRLCRRGLFKQRRILRLSIGYLGKKGKGITGIAKRGWNLYDPTGAAEDELTYHFFSQGYSNCRVYVAVTPQLPARQ